MRYTLGLDVSTQSISAVVLDLERGAIVQQLSLAYREDKRLNRFGIEFDSLLVTAREPGEAAQPPRMFLAGLDAVLEDLSRAGAPLGEIAAVAVSAQQHGHVYLSNQATDVIAALDGPKSSADVALAERFRGAFSYGAAPIWQSANTAREADEIRAFAGGREEIVRLSGSDSPLRFTGAVIRRVANRFPEVYRETAQIALLSSFISSVLAGRPEAPIDWGNGSGMTMMDYSRREWSEDLLAAVAAGQPEGTEGLRRRLPSLAAPTDIVGSIATYFVERYGLNPDCRVTVGSGDNPQSKVMSNGDLFSLGSSFVYMVDTPEPTVDLQGYANSMYDGIGRPFVFACRTNGAMVWDRIRSGHNASIDQADAALRATPIGSQVVVWQPYAESYPVSPAIGNSAVETGTGEFATQYAGLVDGALAMTWHYARGFDTGSGPIAVTGGPSGSREILERIAAMWNRPVYTIGDAGAAMGSAVSAWYSRRLAEGGAVDSVPDELAKIREALLPPGTQIEPDSKAVEAYHGDDGFVSRFVTVFEQKAYGEGT